MKQNSSINYNVVIQLTSDDEIVQKALLNQINNLLSSLPGINIEVVVHGNGISMLLENSSLKNNIERAYKSGIQFLACNNTLISHKLTPSNLFDLIKVIPSAVAHLVTRQYEGWAYLKAG